MRKKDSMDVSFGIVAVAMDACAVFGGFMAATWIRFSSGWIPLRHSAPEAVYGLYGLGAAFGTLLFVIVLNALGLYVRPQMGSFINKIPRLVRGTMIGVVLTIVLAFAVQNEAEFSRLVITIAFGTVLFLLLLERYLLFRIEWNAARHSSRRHKVLILGTDSVAAHLNRTLKREAMLRAQVVGFLRTGSSLQGDVPAEDVRGSLEDLKSILEKDNVDQIILASQGIPHQSIVDILMLCERNMVDFFMVPDLFRILTVSMDVHSLDDIPLLGVTRWPLDHFTNRMLKRIEDVAGSLVGLILVSPVIAIAAFVLKATSRGPVFFAQERCGEKGRVFRIHKLRTMQVGAESETGPVFARENDPRATPVGKFLRKHNIDELPQLWNVLKGEMSLVGPRPERPHFVEKFKEDVGRYMWRHTSKPGMTGWAQVNGLRGNTSIEERIKYDLYYLENWSMSFDFKILVRTVFARENAY